MDKLMDDEWLDGWIKNRCIVNGWMDERMDRWMVNG